MKPKPPQDTPNRDAQLLERIDQLRTELRDADPDALARRAGCQFTPGHNSGGELHLALWGREVRLCLPDWDAVYVLGDEAPHTANLALLIYYFHTVWAARDRVQQEAAEWISFSDLPDGRFYTQAFQGYTGALLTRRFGNQKQNFEAACLDCDGAPLVLGDAAFSFEVLPRAALAAVCWLGDEDFPASYRILFSETIADYLPTDACAIAGSMLTRRIISYH